MKKIIKIHNAENTPIADLVTFRALPTKTGLQFDPFIFLNHHGPQVYPAHNHGLPFGPHPHRGMETVTFILAGDIAHKDSDGHESVITAGGVQWMTAGRGLIHAETSSEQFKKKGGELEILQLWLNLPAKLKMTEPFYEGLQKEKIPSLSLDNGKVTVNVVAGTWGGNAGAWTPKTDVQLNTIYFKAGGKLLINVPDGNNVLFYVISGNFQVAGTAVAKRQLAEFNQEAGVINIVSNSDSILLFGYAMPFNEPMVAQGPFVMNTQQEIQDAYNDFRLGKFGTWMD